VSQPFPPPIPEITPEELKAAMDNGEPLVLLDVREPFEAAISDLPEVGQIRIPMKQIPDAMQNIPRDERVVVYCRSGARSGNVVQFLLSQGWTEVENLNGGVLRWREDVDPTIAAY
jgi:adenylyltransferase/sulfurtransferase